MDPLQTHWRTSSYTNPNNNNCVEVGPTATAVGVRDTKDRARGHITISRAAWATFVRNVAR